MPNISADREKKATKIHEKFCVVDAHNDTVLNIINQEASDNGKEGEGSTCSETYLSEKSEAGQVDLPRIKEGGVNLLVFANWVSPLYDKPLKRLLQSLDRLRFELDSTEGIELATNYSEITGIIESGDVAALMSVEGGRPLEEDLGILRMIKRLGVTSITLTHSGRNALGDGSGADSGSHLTDFGREVVTEMNRLNMIVDVSHLNRMGFFDVVKTSKKPIIASHSNVNALRDHHRNLTDDQITAIAEKEGVVGINFVPHFLRDGKKAGLEDWFDHLEYVIELVGPDYVGLGSDFDGGGQLTEINDVSQMPRITQGLVARGYSDRVIEKILGGNFLRVFQETWN